MRIRVLSDLHLEFHADHGESFLGGQGDDGWDLMVLAGDVCGHEMFSDVWGWVRDAAGRRPVLWVPGNHEFYGTKVPEALVWFEEEAGAHDVVMLDDRVVEVGGRRFVGTTLWFPYEGPDPMDDRLSDFAQIRGFREWVGEKARGSARFLGDSVREGDVVVTHHLPHPRSIHPRYGGAALNRYFLHDVGHLVEGRGAALWCHGHTHSPTDYVVGGTRVVANPFGYLRYEERRGFREYLTVDIS